MLIRCLPAHRHLGRHARIYATIRSSSSTRPSAASSCWRGDLPRLFAADERRASPPSTYRRPRQAKLPLNVQAELLAAFALSFAIKVPMVPLHTGARLGRAT